MKSKASKKKKNSKILEDIVQSSYLGKIVDIDDPEKIGRCKILVYGVYGDASEKLDQIPKDSLPWSYPLNFGFFGKKGAGSFSTPRMDQIVRVMFDGDQYHPRYYAIENLDPDLKAALKEAYENFHSIVFDEEQKLRIYYSTKSGILLNLDNSIINILPDNSILIDHKDSSSTIELRGGIITMKTNAEINASSQNQITLNSNYVHANGNTLDLGANPIWSNVNGEVLMKLIAALATGLDAKYPVTAGQFSGLVQSLEPTILSETVKTSP